MSQSWDWQSPGKLYLQEKQQLKNLLDNNKLDKLQQCSQIGVPNAFHGVRFGLQKERGIHGACPSEMLHAIQVGIFIYTQVCFFHQVGRSSKAVDQNNALSCEIDVLLAQQSDRDKPRTKFSKGIYRGKLMAKEYSWVLMVMVALLWSEKGRRLLVDAWKKGFHEGKLEDWVMLVETLLVWRPTWINLKCHLKKWRGWNTRIAICFTYWNCV